MYSKTSNKNLKNFISYAGRGETTGLSSMEEPTFLGFHIIFDFANSYSKADTEQIVNGLLLSPTDSDSASNFLLRKGKDIEAASLNKFIKILKDIQDNKPWMFQSIEGINNLWGPVRQDKNFDIEQVLTINCLETLDSRMGFLAGLYNRAAYNKVWWRNNLPTSKKRFNCKIIVTESRHFGEMTVVQDHPDVQAMKGESNNSFLNDKIPEVNTVNDIAGNLGLGENKNDILQWGNKNLVNPTNDFLQSSANFGKGVKNQAVDWSGGASDYAAGTELGKFLGSDFTDFKPENSPSDKNFNVESDSSSTLNKIDTLKAKYIFNEIDSKMTFYVFDLFDCEFIFNDVPFLDTVDINNLSTPSNFKFQIKVNDSAEAHQFRFHDWILDDFDIGILTSADDLFIHPNKSLESKYKYAVENLFNWEAKSRGVMANRNPVVQQIDKEEKEESLKAISPADQGNMWDSIAEKYKGIEKIDSQLASLSGGKYKGATVEATKALMKAKDDVIKQKINALNKFSDFNKAFNELDLKNPYSIMTAVDKALGLSGGRKSDLSPTDELSNYDKETKPKVKGKEDLLYRVVRELNGEQVTNNRFWKDSSRQDWKNMGLSSNESTLTQKDEETSKLDYLKNLKKSAQTDNDFKTSDLNKRTVGNNEKISATRLSLNLAKDNFKNVLNNGDYLKDFGSDNTDKLKYRTIRTTFDVPENPDKLFTERAGYEWKNKYWRNMGLKSNNKTDASNDNSKFNYLNHSEKIKFKESVEAVNFGYGKRTTSDGKVFTNVYTTEENSNYNLKKGNFTPIKLTGSRPNDSFTKIKLEGTDPNKDVTPIKLEGPNPNKDITPIKLGGPDVNKDITPIKLEGPDPNKDITPIDLAIPDVNKNIGPVDLAIPNVNKDITPVDLVVPNVNKNITPVDLIVPNVNKNIGPVDLAIPNVNKDITPVDLVVPNVNKNIGPVKLAIPNVNKNIGPVKLAIPNVNKNIGPVKLEGSDVNKNVTSIKLEGAQSNKTITPITLEGGTNSSTITPITLEGLESNKTITPITLEGSQDSKTLTPIKFENNITDKKLTPIKQDSNNKENKITPISLNEAKSDATITPIKLDGQSPNAIITPITLESQNPNDKITPIKLDGQNPNDKITPITLEGIKPNNKFITGHLDMRKPKTLDKFTTKNIYN